MVCKRMPCATMVVAAGLLMVSRPSPGRDKTAEPVKATTSAAGVDAKTAFKRVKSLAGTWNVELQSDKTPEKNKEEGDKHGRKEKVVFKLTAGGSAVTETQHPGSAMEMVSVYHLNGDDLSMTHYCALGNQPRVKLDKSKSTPEHLVFVFDGGTNLDAKKDMHIHGLTITFHQDGRVTSAWEGYEGGKSSGTMSFLMSR